MTSFNFQAVAEAESSRVQAIGATLGPAWQTTATTQGQTVGCQRGHGSPWRQRCNNCWVTIPWCHKLCPLITPTAAGGMLRDGTINPGGTVAYFGCSHKEFLQDA